jgi:hypothetical protein
MGLFNSTVLDVAIGLIFVYLLLSIICTAVNEWLAGVTGSRSKLLKKGLIQLLNNQPTKNDSSPDALIKAFYKHPLIKGMTKPGKEPTYLSARIFAAVVTDVLSAGASGEGEVADLRTVVATVPDGDVKKVIAAVVNHSERNQDANPGQALEGWFNDAMDRVSGWYKRRMQMWTLIVAIVITLAANADTIGIARRLWADPVLRSAVVEEAKVRAQKPRPTVSVEYKDENDPTEPTVTRNEGNTLSDKEKEILGELLGWHGPLKESLKPEVFLGWILTVFALSMGAPFWFDLLNKIMNIRNAGKSPDEKSKGPEKPDTKPRA